MQPGTNCYLCIHPSVHPSIHLSIHPSICPSVHPSFHPGITQQIFTEMGSGLICLSPTCWGSFRTQGAKRKRWEKREKDDKSKCWISQQRQAKPGIIPARFWRKITSDVKICRWQTIIWRRTWQPTAVFLPGKSRGRRNVEGCSPWGLKELDITERLTHRIIAFITVRLSEMQSLKVFASCGSQSPRWPLWPLFLAFPPPGGSQLRWCEVTHAMPRKGSCDVQIRGLLPAASKELGLFNSHVREPSWQWIPQPTSSLQMTAVCLTALLHPHERLIHPPT